MRALPLAAFALAATVSAHAFAQEQSVEPSAREAQKATCQQEANLIYRTGSKGIGMGEDTRNQIIAAAEPTCATAWRKKRHRPRAEPGPASQAIRPRRPGTLP
ncbi:hypothetical protein FS320_07130 [Microvirga tunisiensis]|uniref:Uncharacterized protein n=1 Tax=Microvirga tunisiensis TaxID=2108360 RepID=A0A5N7MDL4_9HYPH|nr:hypothetical protein [Microvirga tunisiensis]MPR25011.1 hypothetical protein [Microvirga tunisiensis]